MTRLTFYVHEQDGDPELWVCRLLDKIARSGQHCFVMGADEAALDALDRRLWTFSQGSFTPHERQGAAAPEAPIVLSTQPPLAQERPTLLLWGWPEPTPPECFSSFERCLEVVAGEESAKAPARARYKHYRERGYHIETHRIGADGASATS